MAMNWRMLTLNRYIKPGINLYELDLTPEEVKEEKRKLRNKKLNRIFKCQENENTTMQLLLSTN